MEFNRELDTRGLNCPLPILKAKKALADMHTGEVLKVVSTDPPYYDNVGYADLSDFFYGWLRRSLKPVFPDLLAMLAVPKDDELVASTYRHGSKENAETFFLNGMMRAMQRLAEQAHPAFPVTIYYAFKQAETHDEDADEGEHSTATASTGWETMLEGLIGSGFSVTGTWPARSEMSTRNVGRGTNALASSIVLSCRPRATAAPLATRREFLTALKRELPEALKHLQRGSIAPVDLAQAAIGPGMAVFTQYAKVMEAEAEVLRVVQAGGSPTVDDLDAAYGRMRKRFEAIPDEVRGELEGREP